MKNKFSSSLLVASLMCSVAPVAMAALEITEEEFKTIQNDCFNTGIESAMVGEELNTFIAQCIQMNTMFTAGGEMPDLAEEEAEMLMLEESPG